MSVESGKILRRLREETGYTQKQLANYLEVDQSNISKIESGDRNLKASLVDKLCSLYNCTPEYLLGQDKHRRPMSFKGSKNADLNTIARLNLIISDINLLRGLQEE